MKTLGLIGGTTWVSTADYYKLINREVNSILGGHHSARIILFSIDFHDAITKQENGNFKGVEEILVNAARALTTAGVEGLLLCANTLHKYADPVSEATGLPLVHIVEETARAIVASGMAKVGLLGTRPTMTEPFYRERMAQKNIELLVPGEDDREFLHRAILDEMSKDIFKDTTRSRILKIMQDLMANGAEGIILGCTEIPLIIQPEDIEAPLFDTLLIHARAAARFIAGD